MKYSSHHVPLYISIIYTTSAALLPLLLPASTTVTTATAAATTATPNTATTAVGYCSVLSVICHIDSVELFYYLLNSIILKLPSGSFSWYYLFKSIQFRRLQLNEILIIRFLFAILYDTSLCQRCVLLLIASKLNCVLQWNASIAYIKFQDFLNLIDHTYPTIFLFFFSNFI